MKQAALWLLPAVALTSVGSLTYATSQPRIESSTNHARPPLVDVGTKENDSHNVSKTVPFVHDSEIDTYLTSVRSFMLTPPRDGRFGASRMAPMYFHNVNRVTGYEDVKVLSKDISFMSFVVGAQSPAEFVHSQNANPSTDPKLQVPKYRTTTVHSTYGTPIYGRYTANRFKGDKAITDVLDSISSVKAKVDKGGYETYSQAVTINSTPGWIMAKAVRASDKSCYGCHNTVKDGEPIGHVVAILWKKASK